MSENLGTARLNLSVDTSDFRAQIEASKKLTTGLGTEAQQAFAKTEGGARRATESFMRYVRGLQNGTEEQKILNAAARGVPVEVLDEARRIVLAQRDATAAAAQQMALLAQQTKIYAQAAAAANEKQAARTDFIRSLEQQVRAIGKTRVDLIELKAAELGVEASARPLIAALREQERLLQANANKAQVATKQFNNYGLSQKQVTAAMRGVPAQITDIFISLQGGQNPLTVLLQQGGQLKDMFGGIVPAARALGGALAGLVNPYTIAAVAAGALFVAWAQGSRELQKYEAALARVNNTVGATAGYLQDSARVIGATLKTTQGAAVDAVVAAASTGKILGENIRVVASAAENLRVTAGTDIKKTVEEFAELGKDPVTAILRLNDAQRFLTYEQYAAIRALQEQGRTQDAATLATKVYADAVNEQANKIETSLGVLDKTWRNLAVGARWAWDAMRDVGRPDTLQEQIDRVAMDIRNTPYPGTRNAYRAQLQQLLRQQTAQNRQEYLNAARQDANNAATSLAETARSYASESEKRALQIAEVTGKAKEGIAKAILAGDSKLAEQIADSRDKAIAGIRARGSKGGAGVSTSTTSSGLQAIRDAAVQEQAVIQNSGRILQAEYSARTVTVEDYYRRQRDLLTQGAAVEEKSVRDQIAFLRDRNVSGKESIDVQRQIGQLEAQLTKVRADSAGQLKVLDIQEQAVIETRKRSIQSYADALNEGLEAQRATVESALARIMVGEREAEQQQRLSKIYADAAKERRRLAMQFQENKDAKLYAANLKALESAVEQEVQIVADGYKRMDEAQANWLNGVNSGINNWMEQARNVAQQTQQIVGNALDGLVDGIANAATRSKASWKDLLADILRQIVSFLAKQAVLQFVQYFASAYTGGGNQANAVKTGGNIKSTPAKFAAGGAMQGPGISAFSGTVVSQPTQFFANGGNVMGEAGPEGILPLKRTSDGKLGVMAAGGGGVQVGVNVNIYSDGNSDTQTNVQGGDNKAMYREFGEMIKTSTKQTVQREMMPGGMLWKAGVRANG